MIRRITSRKGSAMSQSVVHHADSNVAANREAVALVAADREPSTLSYVANVELIPPCHLGHVEIAPFIAATVLASNELRV